jgi:hypothetical protein
MNINRLVLASLILLHILNACADGVVVEAGGTYTATGSPVQSVITGPTTANGGLGGTASSTTGEINANGGLGGSGGLGGTSSSSGNTSGNNTISTKFNAAKIPVSMSYAPANLPTAPCMGSTSVGLTSVILGFSSGTSWEATECMILEMARSFSQDGQFQDAQAVRCSSKYATNAPSCIKLKENQIMNKKNTAYVEPFPLISELKSDISSTHNPVQSPEEDVIEIRVE